MSINDEKKFINKSIHAEVNTFFNRDLIPHINHYICSAENVGRSLWNDRIKEDLNRIISMLFDEKNCSIIGSRFYDFARGRSILDLHVILGKKETV